MSSAPEDQALVDEIAAMVRELEQLPLVKGERDRRLALNARLEQARAQLAARERARALSAELAAVVERLAQLTAGEKAQRRELQRQRSRLEAELAEVQKPGV